MPARAGIVVVLGAAALAGTPGDAHAQAPSSYGGGMLPTAGVPPPGYHPSVALALQPRGNRIALRFDTSVRCGRTSYDVTGRRTAAFDGVHVLAREGIVQLLGGGRRLLFSWTVSETVSNPFATGTLRTTGVLRRPGHRGVACARSPLRSWQARLPPPGPRAPAPPAPRPPRRRAPRSRAARTRRSSTGCPARSSSGSRTTAARRRSGPRWRLAAAAPTSSSPTRPLPRPLRPAPRQLHAPAAHRAKRDAHERRALHDPVHGRRHPLPRGADRPVHDGRRARHAAAARERLLPRRPAGVGHEPQLQHDLGDVHRRRDRVRPRPRAAHVHRALRAAL